MKRFLILFALLYTLCFSAHSQAGVAGWNYQWWDCCGSGSWVVNTPYNNQGGANSAQMYAYGWIKWPGTATQTSGARTINFAAGWDDNGWLKVNGTTVATYSCCTNGFGSYTANVGDIVKIELYGNNYGGGTWGFQALWDLQGTGSYTYINGQYVATTADYWGPSVVGGTITQSNAPSNQIITSGGTSTAGITAQQQTRVDTWSNVSGSRNLITIDQVYGSNNQVTFTQEGTKNKIEFTLNGNNNVVKGTQTGSNYLKEEVPGWGNNITTIQTNTVGTNFAETKIQGNGNTVNHTQTGNGNKILFSTVQGDINTLNTTQSGDASHFLETKLTGNFNNVKVDQSGSIANKANIDVTNAGGAATVDLQQTGGKNFTIIQSCVNPAGCSTVVRQ